MKRGYPPGSYDFIRIQSPMTNSGSIKALHLRVWSTRKLFISNSLLLLRGPFDHHDHDGDSRHDADANHGSNYDSDPSPLVLQATKLPKVIAAVAATKINFDVLFIISFTN